MLKEFIITVIVILFLAAGESGASFTNFETILPYKAKSPWIYFVAMCMYLGLAIWGLNLIIK